MSTKHARNKHQVDFSSWQRRKYYFVFIFYFFFSFCYYLFVETENVISHTTVLPFHFVRRTSDSPFFSSTLFFLFIIYSSIEIRWVKIINEKIYSFDCLLPDDKIIYLVVCRPSTAMSQFTIYLFVSLFFFAIFSTKINLVPILMMITFNLFHAVAPLFISFILTVFTVFT